MLTKLKADFDGAIIAEIDELKSIDIETIFNTMESNHNPPQSLPVVLIQKHVTALEKYDHFMNMFFNGQQIKMKNLPSNLDISQCNEGGSNIIYTIKAAEVGAQL